MIESARAEVAKVKWLKKKLILKLILSVLLKFSWGSSRSPVGGLFDLRRPILPNRDPIPKTFNAGMN